jgi:hypothetical protein
MADDKTPPATTVDDDFAEGLKKIAAAQQIEDDEADIAADDEGASAMAQKLGKLGDDRGSSQR